MRQATNKNKRKEYILQQLKEKDRISVAEISRQFGCSEVTARTDIRELDAEGLVKRNYGGAARIEPKENKELVGLASDDVRYAQVSLPFAIGKYYLNREEKYRIAAKAYEYIVDQDTIMLDDSTTCCHLAQYISKHSGKEITIVTNSLFVAAVLSNTDHVNTYILGGHVLAKPAAAMDNLTAETLENYHVSKLFTGINRIDLRVGLTSADADHANVKKAMISVSDEVYVLADHTKFASCSLFTVCPVNQVHHIITDTKIDRGIVQMAFERGISMDVV